MIQFSAFNHFVKTSNFSYHIHRLSAHASYAHDCSMTCRKFSYQRVKEKNVYPFTLLHNWNLLLMNFYLLNGEFFCDEESKEKKEILSFIVCRI